MGELASLPNIGPIVEKQLLDAGIENYEELKEIGAEEAWLRIQKIDPSACIHRLFALEGAIKEIKKSELSKTRKEELKSFYRQHKIK